MPYGFLECSVECPKCDGAVPLNGPWEGAHCDRCQNDFAVPHAFWGSVLGDLGAEVRDLEEGQARNSTIFGIFRATLLLGRLESRCEKCKTPIEVAAAPAAPLVNACASCGSKTDVVPSPAWLREALPAVDYLVSATLRPSVEGSGVEATGPVIFSCPQCAGALRVDGTDRLVPCAFCKASVYLPDDLWLRLHPVKTKTRWFAHYVER